MESLPGYFAVQQKPLYLPTLYLLLKASFIMSKDAWKIDVIGSPKWIISKMVWRSDGIDTTSKTFKCISKNNTTIESASISRTKNYMIVPGFQNIPILKMTDMAKILSDNIEKYTEVDEYHFSINSFNEIMRMPSHSSNPVPVPVPVPVEEQPSNPTVLQTPIAVRVAEPVATIRTKFVAKIPQHIFKIYLENAINSEETCPITLEKFTLENVACTPCGHLFDRDAIKMNLERSPLCPTCRTKIRANELQTL